MRQCLFSTLLLCASLAAGVTFADASHVKVSATLSTNTVQVGDRVILTVTAEHDTNQRILIEDIERQPFVTVWDIETTTKDIKNARQVTEHCIEFSSFVVGEHRVSTNNLIVLKPDGSQHFVSIPNLLINISTVLSNPPPSLAEIKPAMPLPSDRWIRILIMVLVILVVGALIAFLIRRWIIRPEKPESIRVTPPHDIAITALETLLKRGYIENGEAEPFYVELSSIIRLYLEERFNLHAPEQTTEEFIRTSSHSNALSVEHRQLTQDFLEQSDLVKFAKFTPGADDMRTAWDAGARLVRETIPPATQRGEAAS